LSVGDRDRLSRSVRIAAMTIMACTQEVTAVSAVTAVGTACQAGVKAVVPQAVFGTD
jgi:hypothetical protein